MRKPKTICSYFTIQTEGSTSNNAQEVPENIEATIVAPPPPQQMQLDGSDKLEIIDIGIASLVRDPGLRKQIWKYPVNQQDEIRQAYIKAGPYHPKLDEYPLLDGRRFCYSWFAQFSSWLEYSPTTQGAYCLPCYLFGKAPSGCEASKFVDGGFRKWKKVNNGVSCAFLRHVGRNPNSVHKNAIQACCDLMNASQYIGSFIEKHTFTEIEINRLRLQVSIDVIRWLTFQACAFRGHDESIDSLNRGNFLELIKLLASYNERVSSVVLSNAPTYASYTSSQIQKEILSIFSDKVKREICEAIGDAKFCIIVDEAHDESKREQMALVLRFVDKKGFIRKHFFGLVHVKDTTALTLKESIFFVLFQHNLLMQNIRGQGYDGASNMRGEWNGLQALICNECPYAYYIHCLAHRLQLALVVASREVPCVHQFFSNLVFIINIVTASSKRNDELKEAQAVELAAKIANNEIESRRGKNQRNTLIRARDTRWGSHLASISSLLKMFNATSLVLSNISKDGASYSQRGDAEFAWNQLLSFDFIFILHLMKELMKISHILCQALQHQSQDILNAMHLVSTTKTLIQNFRDYGWDSFFSKVQAFCEEHVTIPDMNAQYTARRGRCRNQRNEVSVEHYYRVDVFITIIDYQLQELNSRFNEQTVELLVLSCALDPRDGFRYFNVDQICKLAEKFYPGDFTEQEILLLRMQFQHFELDIPMNPQFEGLSGIQELCQRLVETNKATIYPLIDRLVRLVLTLPVSTATTERAFSIMKIVKTKLRNKMENKFLNDCLIVFIEKEIAMKFSTESIIDEFNSMKTRRAKLQHNKKK